jgi:hypothetical protein
MTEQEWLACTDLKLMLHFLWGKVSDRKFRLFVTACCRRIWHLMPDERMRNVEVAEMCADGLADPTVFPVIKATLRDVIEPIRKESVTTREAGDPVRAARIMQGVDAGEAARLAVYENISWAADKAAEAATWGVVRVAPLATASETIQVSGQPERESQVALLLDLFGNPFRSISIIPAWRTPSVLAVAQATYDNRKLPSGALDNDHLAILADSMEDAGCDNADILNHLRQAGAHVRGCWPLDLILGKT